MASRTADRPRARWIAAGGAAAAVLTAAALVGASAGCITAFAPNIRRAEHHAAVSSGSTRGACLTCHELESHMARRMQHMDAATLERHMQEMNQMKGPPLVADWMAKESRGCVDCHKVKGGR